MRGKRRKFKAVYKAKVAQAAILGHETLKELSVRFEGSRPVCGEKLGCVTFKNRKVRV